MERGIEVEVAIMQKTSSVVDFIIALFSIPVLVPVLAAVALISLPLLALFLPILVVFFAVLLATGAFSPRQRGDVIFEAKGYAELDRPILQPSVSVDHGV